ncbi:hypothetical protein EV356DRAFT_581599 [Viridothelium virens]|uniref:Heterokaryon incompatibility domain-containing protein n=1 Tax=Viridothelium virens TaxID=1048519 RepID=A0A6A6GRN8_VIRVR|nr:hypothetical protein EV356DRAFT_581599 [Viridothelium virens]
MLSRLPELPPELPLEDLAPFESQNANNIFPPAYTKMLEAGSERTGWGQLKVVSLLDGCTIRLALAIANHSDDSYDHSLGYDTKFYLDRVARILELLVDHRLTYAPKSPCARTILIAYLWSTWQRSVTLFLSVVLSARNSQIYDAFNGDTMLALSYPKFFSRHSFTTAWRGLPDQISQYMCAWAFKLLQNSRISLALDFRNFHRRFAEAHPHSQPRCTTTSQVCYGSSPEMCGRFNCKQLVFGDQSLHDNTCRGCKRTVWDTKSYMKISGGRAVDISRGSSKIQYRRADTQTLAISHVWSHGQGGRPSTGINKCLHRRYVNLARKHGCKSYWIDTVCIPEDHDLRREAISHINDIFGNSKITLVCDRDLSSLSVPDGDDDVAQMERLLATLLVCDWNVRAWTMLESVRGQRNVHLLCAKNQTVSFAELVHNILSKGALDIAILSITSMHLLVRTWQGKFNIVHAGAILSHRYATRVGDDVVIWSLMSAKQKSGITSDPLVFWKASQGCFLNTGYLMSSVPRLTDTKGLNWAPCSPNVQSQASYSRNSSSNTFFSDGDGSEVGLVTAKGLEAIWLVHQIEPGDDEKYGGDGMVSLSGISGSGQTTVNLCWERVLELRQTHHRVCLLMPKSQSSGRQFDAEQERDPLLVTAFSDSPNVKMSKTCEDEWNWAGVYEWPSQIPLPEMDWEKILLM